MKRYRVNRVDFDSRPMFMTMEIKEEWEPRVKELWRRNQKQIRETVITEFGISDYEQKLANFGELGRLPMSVVSFHNKFLNECRRAFIFGSYYPALVGTCALGERILNHLVLRLRSHFKGTAEYKRVHRKESFDNWELAITALETWRAIRPSTAALFRQLAEDRNRVVHFRPEVDTNDRDLAQHVLHIMSSIIEEQFASDTRLPWYISGVPGATFVKKEYENDPFVQEIILPCCFYVGPNHRLKRHKDGWLVEDEQYVEEEISDTEFVELYCRSTNDRD